MNINLRLLYLYLFSFVGLLIVVIGSIQIIDLGMKMFVFPDADNYYIYPTMTDKGELAVQNIEEEQIRQKKETSRNRQRQASTAMSMIFVGAPLYLYHWRLIKNER